MASFFLLVGRDAIEQGLQSTDLLSGLQQGYTAQIHPKYEGVAAKESANVLTGCTST